MKPSAVSLLSIPVPFSSIAIAATFGCEHVRSDGIKFNFKSLDGPHSVSVIDETPPTIQNTTWTVDICKQLEVKKSNLEDQCPAGTWICGINTIQHPNEPDKGSMVSEVIPIAGQYATQSGKVLDPKWTRLKAQGGGEEGLEIEFHGGTIQHNVTKENRNQKAIIKFICDKSRTGNEARDITASKLVQRDDSDDKTNTNNSLKYISYPGDDDNIDILRLEWRTSAACEDSAEPDNDGNKKGGWGFFTWLILLLFLGIAAYLIFGSWLNYNRYGARGWDLLPHGDTIRDIPYLFKDWSRKVVDTVSGGGSRGGYSAV